MLTEVRDCDLLIVVTSSTFLKRKNMLKETSSYHFFRKQTPSASTLFFRANLLYIFNIKM